MDELVRIANDLASAQNDLSNLQRRFGNAILLTPQPLKVSHSYRNDGGDASRKGAFELFLTEAEIKELMERRLLAAQDRVKVLSALKEEEQSKFTRVSP